MFRHSCMRAVFIILSVVPLYACSTSGLALFVANSVARLGEFEVTKALSYGNPAAHYLDVYTPDSTNVDERQGLPVVIFFYGGCWGACSTLRKEKYAFVAETLTTNGYVAVLADYRLYPDVLFPEIISDAALVVEWVRNNIQKYGGDTKAIFLMGHSSGAHLAATLTMDERYLQPGTHESIKGFIGLAGPYDFLPFDQDYQKILFGPREKHADSQPINFVDGSEPPFLLLYGNQDQVVKARNIERLSEKANLLGVSVTRYRYADINHAGLVAALSRVLRKKRPVAGDVIAFLDENSRK